MVMPKKGAIPGYKPESPPSDLPASAQRYLDNELNRIANLANALLARLSALTPATELPTMLRLAPTHAEPVDPVMPMIVYTDGQNWDPGSGEGYYYYNSSGVWTPLG